MIFFTFYNTNLFSFNPFIKKSLLTFLFILGFLLIANAQRIASVSGNWSNTSTWGGAAIPTIAETVSINSGITVTMDVA